MRRPRTSAAPAEAGPRGLTALLLVGLLASLGGPGAAFAGTAAASAAEAEPDVVPMACPLCDGHGAPAAVSDDDAFLSAAEALARANAFELARIDSLRRSGALGAPASRESARRAQLLARLTLRNWYSFLLPFAADPERVHEIAPSTVASVLARFRESGVFPAPRLRSLRLGMGRACARYDLGGPPEEGETQMGGRRLGYRVADVRAGGAVRRVLALNWPSASAGRTQALLSAHYALRLEHSVRADAAGPYELFTATDVTGAWVRRYGTHRPAAFLFWTTQLRGAGQELPNPPRVGSAIYLPGLRLRIPIVPDINFEDLRTLGLPMPFLAVADLRLGVLPDWMALDGEEDLADWWGVGAPPPELAQLFPDR